MPKVVKGITIEIDANGRGFQKALSEINKESKKTGSQLKDINKLLKLDPKNTELLEQKQRALNTALEQTKSRLEIARTEFTRLKEANPDQVTAKMDSLQRQIAEDENQVKSLNKQLKEFGNVGKQQAMAVAKEMQETGKKVADVGSKIKGVGDSLTTHVTAPIVAVGTASGVLASSFEDAMAKVSTIADTDSVPLETLKDQIMDLSDQTGISASQIAENVYNAISAGQETGDAVSFVAEASKLAKAGFADSADALDILTTTLNAYGMEAEDVTKVSDILINTQNLGKTTVAELSSSMGKVIPTAKSQGVELEELASAYAVMTSNGIATAESTTYLNSMLNELGKEGTTASDAFREGTKDIQEGGLSMAEAMEQGWTLTDVLGVLQEQADESGTSIGNMFGSAEAGKSATVLIDNADKFNESLEAMYNSTGATDEAFGKLDTTSQRAQIALNELKNLGIEIGTVLLEQLSPAIEQAKTVLENLKAKWDEMSPEAKNAVIIIAEIIAVVGPLVSIIGSIVMFVGNLMIAVGALSTTLGVSVGVIGGVVVAIGAIIAIIVICIMHWDKIKETVKNVWESISQYMSNLKESVTQKWEQIKQGISQRIDSIKANLSAKWNQIKSDTVNKIIGMKNDVVNKYIELKNSAIEKVSAMKADVINKYNELKDSAIDKVKAMKSSVGEKLSAIKQDFVDKWEAIKSNTIDKIVGMKDDAVQKFVDMKTKIIEKINELKDKIKDKLDKIKSFFSDLKLKIPKPEMPSLPSFSLETSTRTVFGKEITYPSGISVNWNAKAMEMPYLFTNPTVVQTPYGLVGGGDAGHEIMYGKDALMRDITQANAVNNEALINGFYVAMVSALKSANMSVNISGREFGRILREAGAL